MIQMVDDTFKLNFLFVLLFITNWFFLGAINKSREDFQGFFQGVKALLLR